MPPVAIDSDRIVGALMGTAVGDALGMPVERFSHQNIRTHFKGVKDFIADEKRDGTPPGRWTGDTQRAFALARAFASGETYAHELARLDTEGVRWESAPLGVVARLRAGISPEEAGDLADTTNSGAVAAAAAGCLLAREGGGESQVEKALKTVNRHPVALVAALGQAHAVRLALPSGRGALNGHHFITELTRIAQALEARLDESDGRCSDRLARLSSMLDDYPLDLQDACDGTGPAADESWPFAVAMFARAPELLEASLLSAINVGGDANSVGAMLGALLGAYHGWSAFPAQWRSQLFQIQQLEQTSDQLVERLSS